MAKRIAANGRVGLAKGMHAAEVLTNHGVGLARAGGAIGKHRAVEALHHAQCQGADGALVDMP